MPKSQWTDSTRRSRRSDRWHSLVILQTWKRNLTPFTFLSFSTDYRTCTWNTQSLRNPFLFQEKIRDWEKKSKISPSNLHHKLHSKILKILTAEGRYSWEEYSWFWFQNSDFRIVWYRVEISRSFRGRIWRWAEVRRERGDEDFLVVMELHLGFGIGRRGKYFRI